MIIFLIRVPLCQEADIAMVISATRSTAYPALQKNTAPHSQSAGTTGKAQNMEQKNSDAFWNYPSPFPPLANQDALSNQVGPA